MTVPVKQDPSVARHVSLKVIAKYLECNPAKLAIALRHLAEGLSVVQLGEPRDVAYLVSENLLQAMAPVPAPAPAPAAAATKQGKLITMTRRGESSMSGMTQEAGVTCRKCGTDTTRRTHEGPKRGKTMWYAWYFYCAACGWMSMPPAAVRHVDADIAAASPASPQTEAFRHQDAGDDGRAPW